MLHVHRVWCVSHIMGPLESPPSRNLFESWWGPLLLHLITSSPHVPAHISLPLEDLIEAMSVYQRRDLSVHGCLRGRNFLPYLRSQACVPFKWKGFFRYQQLLWCFVKVVVWWQISSVFYAVDTCCAFDSFLFSLVVFIYVYFRGEQCAVFHHKMGSVCL